MPALNNVSIIVDTVNTANLNPNSPAKAYSIAENSSAVNAAIQAQIGDTLTWSLTPIIPTDGCVITGVTPTGNTGPFPSITVGFVNGVWQGTAVRAGTQSFSVQLAIANAFAPNGGSVTPFTYTVAQTVTVS